MAETQAAENSPKPLGSIFTRPDAPASSDGDASPSPTDTAPAEEKETKEAVAAAEDKKSDVESAEGDKPVSEVKAEAETKDEKPKEEATAEGDAKPKIDWDSDENPFKQRIAEVEKRARDSANWATQINKQYLQLQKQQEIFNKKLDGTYDPNVDDPKPDPQAIVLQAQAEGKMLGSLDAAYLQFGKGDKKAGQEFVDKEISRYNELFAENQHVQSQVWSSPAPVFAALKMLRDFDISQKYGTTDVTELIGKAKAEARAELEKELTEKITKQLMDGIAMKKQAVTGITGARAATKIDGEKPPAHAPLSAIFG